VPIHRLADFILNWEQSAFPILICKSELHQTILSQSG